MYREIQALFDRQLEVGYAHTLVRLRATEEYAHGREAHRDYFICPVPDELPDRSRWAKLKAIGIAIHHTRRVARALEGRWGMENCLHWQLDVTFQEDQCRIRHGHADANFSLLRRAALSLLKNNHTR